MNIQIFRICSALALAVVLAFPFRPAMAELISTENVAAGAKVQADREKLRAFVSRADAERELKALGVKPELARQRVDAMTDEEVERIAGKIDALPAGADLGKSDLTIILLVAILVVVAVAL